MIEQISFAKTYGVAHIDSLLQVLFLKETDIVFIGKYKTQFMNASFGYIYV